jgi:hypothetical protein
MRVQYGVHTYKRVFGEREAISRVQYTHSDVFSEGGCDFASPAGP